MVWVDESSSVGERMTVISHKIVNVSSGRTRKPHCLTTAWWLSLTSLLFLIFNKVLKVCVFHWSGAHRVCLLFDLLSAPFLEINKIPPALNEKSEMCSLANVWGTPARAPFFAQAEGWIPGIQLLPNRTG